MTRNSLFIKKQSGSHWNPTVLSKGPSVVLVDIVLVQSPNLLTHCFSNTNIVLVCNSTDLANYSPFIVLMFNSIRRYKIKFVVYLWYNLVLMKYQISHRKIWYLPVALSSTYHKYLTSIMYLYKNLKELFNCCCCCCMLLLSLFLQF